MLRFIKYVLSSLLLVSCAHAGIIKQLPGIGKLTPAQYAGYAAIDNTKTRLYYWLIPADKNSKTKPLIIWFNGGPGSSSMYGPLMEVGPHIFNRQGKIVNNPYSWTQVANLMIIEQPLSVGASVINNQSLAPNNNVESSQQLYSALQHILKKFPDLKKQPIYLAGESYAGTTLAYFSETILQHKNPGFRLRGLILNDIWFNPITQTRYDSLYAYTHGLINLKQKQRIDRMYQHCSALIRQQTPSSIQANQYCGKILTRIKKLSGVYALNIMDSEPDYSALQNYLNQPAVQQAMHMQPHTPYALFSKTISKNYTVGEQDSVLPLYNDILSKKISVMIMSGLLDATDCNFLGIDASIRQMDWPGKSQYEYTQPHPWRDTDQTILGYQRDGGGLTRVTVFNGGHMLPMDQPKIIAVVKAFIHQ